MYKLFSNFADFRHLQTPNERTKYYKILPAYTTTSHNTILKIASLYLEFKYHFFDIAEKNSDYFWTRLYVYIHS